jgi:hypothetical protein
MKAELMSLNAGIEVRQWLLHHSLFSPFEEWK